jgi:hypothetical protein
MSFAPVVSRESHELTAIAPKPKNYGCESDTNLIHNFRPELGETLG